MDILDDTDKKMSAAIEHLKEELRALRTGRANPGMVEKVLVDVYGAQMRLSDLASISVPEPRQLLISPYDGNNVHAISKGIELANLGFQPAVDGHVIRITVPEMDSSMRNELVKVAKKKCEDAKVSIRNARRDGNEIVKKQKSSGEIPEDLMKVNEKKIQDFTDKYCKFADKLVQEKENEIVKI
ncbi:MAG: Ribosome-recycling factor [Chlamydiales bacterium]|nr:Ribosome-recycling factor [Chlamydiales bacterium]MCH9619680.1 Ribosome-recycling factor [Chlamydiales bacterium]MCH9623286.1 Ribosome-recycling factor [Chlamydiales bacterium]